MPPFSHSSKISITPLFHRSILPQNRKCKSLQTVLLPISKSTIRVLLTVYLLEPQKWLDPRILSILLSILLFGSPILLLGPRDEPFSDRLKELGRDLDGTKSKIGRRKSKIETKSRDGISILLVLSRFSPWRLRCVGRPRERRRLVFVVSQNGWQNRWKTGTKSTGWSDST